MGVKTISFKTSGPVGDLISFLAGVKHVCETQDAKADIYVWMDQQAFYYQGAVHPYGSSMINQYAFDMLKPLILAQDYINSFQPWNGEQIVVDLDKHRERHLGMPYGSIHRWLGFVYPDMQCDLSERWLQPNGDIGTWQDTESKILVNMTSRYRKPYLSYWFLQEYQSELLFVGLPEEHETFNKQWGLEIKHYQVKDFNQLAYAINSCRFFLGNQSMCYAIAEAMKVPRLLEVCEYAPNVIPFGPNAYDYQFQEGLVYHFERMYKEF